MNRKFNGWHNYQTWNVALYIGNDESLYNIAKNAIDYNDFRDVVMGFESQTSDGVFYDDDRLCIEELDRLIKELG